MKIDLIYNYRSIDTSYIIYGPEKIGSNIEVSTDGYIVNSISEVINKINSMVASLAPDITNCQSVSSGLYGNMYMQTWRGDLNAGSEVPDYTNILTSINTNLTNLNSKFNCTVNANSNISLANLISNIFQYNNGSSSMRLNNINSTSTKDKGNLVNILSQLVNSFSSNIGISEDPINISNSKKILQLIFSSLKQSVSPNSSITDVISSLNSNIHNDLTNINTTENNKDTVLIIDGQQEFKLHKDDE